MKGKYWVNPDINMESIKDSMQLDSRQTICTLTDNQNNQVSLECLGDVKIIWNGEVFRTPSSFPNELKKLIAENDLWYQDKHLEIIESNYFDVAISVPSINKVFQQGPECTCVHPEGMSYEKIKNILISYLKDIYPEIFYKKAVAYAKASLYYYNKGDLRRAARYWNKIYSVKIKLSTENLVKVMRIFPSKAVYDITEEIKRASGYYDSMFPYKKKFPLLYGCTDHELIFSKLREEKLLFIERILYAYENGQIDFEEPKNDDGEYLFCGEAELICLDKKYKPTGLETTVLRWYESHEDTEFLIEVFSED